MTRDWSGGGRTEAGLRSDFDRAIERGKLVGVFCDESYKNPRYVLCR